MDTKTKIRYGIIAFGIISVMLIVFALFNILKKRDDTMFKELIAAHDREVKAIQGQRDIFLQMNREKDQLIIEFKRNDSLLAISQQKIKIVYEKVPGTVRNYNNDELRSAVFDFAEQE
ncbi:MAG TPA: hypothetical protein VF487_20255 [Chitinophagaceae bacterium]